MFGRFLGILTAVGCTVDATKPVEPGTGLTAAGDGVITVDPASVPVVPNCADGQFVRRAGSGWECATVIEGSFTPSCAAGSAVRAIDAEGNVTCESTEYDGGDGLTLLGTTFAVDFAGGGSATTVARSDHTHSYVPIGTMLTCSGTDKVRGLNMLTGDVLCDTDVDTGTGTPYTAGPGLDLAANEFSVSFAGFSCGGTDKLVGFDAAGAPLCRPDKALPTNIPRSNVMTAVSSAGNTGRYASIAIGADGLPVISHVDLSATSLVVAKCRDSACSAGTTLTTVDSVGGGTSLVIGADGLPIIAYYDDTALDLKVAKCADDACSTPCGAGTTCTTVDAAGDVGRFPAIAIGTDGTPIITYYDALNGDLMVVKCGDPDCAETSNINIITPMDTGPADVGLDSAIAISLTTGRPVVVYSDVTNDALKTFFCADSVCNVPCGAGTTCDTAYGASGHASITIDVHGNAIVSHAAGPNLVIIRCFGPACGGAPGGAMGLDPVPVANSSIAIGPEGFPIVSYRDVGGGSLKVAKCNDTTCSVTCGLGGSTCTTVDTTGDSGWDSSIAIGAEGLPIIAHYDSVGQDLRVVKCANPFCMSGWSRR